MKGFRRIDVDKNICFPAKINHLELIIQNHRLLERLVSFQTPMAWHQYSETELILIVFAMDTFISNVNGGRRIITESYLLSRYYLLKTWVRLVQVDLCWARSGQVRLSQSRLGQVRLDRQCLYQKCKRMPFEEYVIGL